LCFLVLWKPTENLLRLIDKMPPNRKAPASKTKEKITKVISKENKKTKKSTVATKRNAKLSADIPELVTANSSATTLANKSSKYIVSIEACKSWQVFKRRATQIFTDLCSLIPKHQLGLVINDELTPRRGSFEISVRKTKSDEPVLVWSGIKKGPPRKEKFPEATEILQDVLSALEL